MAKDARLKKAKPTVANNLLHLKNELLECTEEGMRDDNSHFYNEILALMDDVDLVTNEEELEEAIALAKVLETDINVWLSLQGRSSISLEWPVFY